MNASRLEQRILKVLAQGGVLLVERDQRKTLVAVEVLTRDGWFVPDTTPALFLSLRAKRLISSREPGRYRISRAGLLLLQRLRR